jgi:hypothetical protein
MLAASVWLLNGGGVCSGHSAAAEKGEIKVVVLLLI